MGLLSTYRFIEKHPFTRGRKLEATKRWLRWQLGSRLLGYPAVVPFIDDMRMLVRSGMTGATGNLYCGLHEFEDMGFVLHFLRPGDLFVDIGANVGSYTLLAAAAGARVVAFEPVPATHEALMDNIQLNRLASKVDARNQAVGASIGSLTMIADQDTTNQALDASETYQGQTVQVPMVPLDSAFQGERPKLIKIDVEGFETEVFRGGKTLFADQAVQAIIMELNGSGARYGFDESELHAELLSLGYSAAAYDPLTRQLRSLGDKRSKNGNTLYVRNIAETQLQLAESRTYRVANELL